MNVRKLLMLFGVGVYLQFISGSLAAQTILPITEAVKGALERNYNIQIARNDSLIASEANSPGNAGMLPTLAINSNGLVQGTSINQRFSNGLEVNTSGVRGNQLGASVNLGWTLFDGGRMFINRKSLSETEAQAGLSLRNQMEQTAQQVFTSYFNLLSIEKQIEAAEKNRDFAAEQLKIMSKRLEIGSASRQEFLQSQIDFNSASIALKRLQNQQEAEKVLLKRIAVLPFETNFLVSEEGIPDFNRAIADIINDAQGRNMAVLLAESNLRLQEFNEKNLKSQRYPSLIFNGAYNYNRTSSTAGFALFNQSTGPSAALGLSWNIFDGSRLNSSIKQAQIQSTNLKLLIEDSRAELNAQIRIAYQNYSDLKQMESMSADNLTLSEDNYQLALEQLKAGTGSIIQVKEASRSFAAAAADYAVLRSQRQTSEIELLRLSGNLIR